MLSPDQRRDLRVRASLDKIEAESEIRAAQDNGTFSMKFSEATRQQLEKLAAYHDQPAATLIQDAQKRESIRFASLLKTLEKIEKTDTNTLQCAAFSDMFPSDPSHHLTAFITDQESIIHRICEIVTDDRWHEQIEKLRQTPEVNGYDDRLAMLEELASTPVTTQWVTVPTTTLTPAFVEHGLRSWLEKYYPTLSEIEIEWLPDEQKQDFAATLTSQSLLKSFAERPEVVDELIEAISQRLKEKD